MNGFLEVTMNNPNKRKWGTYMKKIDVFKGRRYYQNGFGLFIDIERCGGETNILMGTTMNQVYPVAYDMPVARRAVCCTFYDEQHSIDKECMEAFEKVYGRFESAYIFYCITDEFDQPYEKCYDKSLNMDDFCELEVTRYKHKSGKEKFYIDVEVCRNPEEPDDVQTNMYIMKASEYGRILCDRYAYEVPKQKYKDILKKNFDKYIWIYREEMVDQEYYIPYHEKPHDNGGGNAIAMEDFMGDRDIELPFQ